MKLFNLQPKVLIGVGIFLLLFFMGFAFNRCHAGPLDAPYVQLSGGAAIVRGETAAMELTFTQPAPQLQKAYWQESLTLIGTSTYNGQSVPNNFIGRVLFVDGFGRLDLGLGLSWMQNYLPYNGGNVNFNLQLAYRLRVLPVTLTYAHFSDGGTRLPNLGRDLVLVGWRFH